MKKIWLKKIKKCKHKFIIVYAYEIRSCDKCGLRVHNQIIEGKAVEKKDLA
jgi:hypothetical protein